MCIRDRVRTGELVDEKLAELLPLIPVGLELESLYPENVIAKEANNGFIINLIESILIVIVIIMLVTVSYTHLDNPDISQETRNLIHAYAREHNYKPNVLAVNLRASRINTIGVIVPQLVHHFFSCVLSGIETAAAKAGYNIIVAQSNESYEQEVKIVHSFLAARVCGVISSLAKDTSQYDHYQELLNNNIPIVFYDRRCV